MPKIVESITRCASCKFVSIPNADSCCFTLEQRPIESPMSEIPSWCPLEDSIQQPPTGIEACMGRRF